MQPPSEQWCYWRRRAHAWLPQRNRRCTMGMMMMMMIAVVPAHDSLGSSSLKQPNGSSRIERLAGCKEEQMLLCARAKAGLCASGDVVELVWLERHSV